MLVHVVHDFVVQKIPPQFLSDAFGNQASVGTRFA